MSLFHAGLQPALDGDGNPISGATWTFYLTETLTPTPVYSNEALSVSLGSSEASDADGRFPNPMFLDDAILTRAILRDAGGTTIEDIDPVNAEANAGATSFLSYVPRSLAQYQQNGETDQQAFEAAIVAMSAAEGPVVSGWYPEGAGLFIPEGEYTLTGPLDIVNASGTANVHFWAVPGTVKINVAAGEYAVDCDDYLSSLDIYGINFVGGKGAFRQQFTGIEVNSFKRIEKCNFINYTECAIASNASDDPYWKINNCVFFGSGADTRGIALGGLIDDLEIANNTFLKNQYHMVLGPLNSGNVRVHGNSLLSFAAGLCDADIWIVPSDQTTYGQNSGQACDFSGNKLGNENLAATAPRILFAVFNTGAGTGRENYAADLTWTTSAAGESYCLGIQFGKNRWVQNGLYTAPLMRSYVAQVGNILFHDDNEFDGGTAKHLIEWMGARSTTYQNEWDVRFGPYAELIGYGSPFTDGVSNYPIGPVMDAGGYDISEKTLCQPYCPPLGNEQTLLFCDANGDWTEFSSATKTTATDPRGGTTATEVTAMSANNIALYSGFNATGGVGKVIWLYLQLKRDPTRSITRLKIDVYNATSGVTALTRRVLLTDGFQPLCEKLTLPTASPAGWQIRLTPLDYTVTTADRFIVGNCHINTGPMPLLAPPAAVIADPTGGATVDAEARTAIAALIDAVQALGGIKTV